MLWGTVEERGSHASVCTSSRTGCRTVRLHVASAHRQYHQAKRVSFVIAYTARNGEVECAKKSLVYNTRGEIHAREWGKHRSKSPGKALRGAQSRGMRPGERILRAPTPQGFTYSISSSQSISLG